MITASDIARYFIANPQGEQDISHLKIQKLMFFAQAVHLGMHGVPLFADNILRWKYGPVVRRVYDEYKVHREKSIPPVDPVDQTKYSAATRRFLDGVFAIYGHMSGGALLELSHQTRSWKETAENATIKHVVMMQDFMERLGPMAKALGRIDLTPDEAAKVLSTPGEKSAVKPEFSDIFGS
jgi:uncharacterized phage-associated protein